MLYGLTTEGRRIRLAEEATDAGLVFLPPAGVTFVRFELCLPDSMMAQMLEGEGELMEMDEQEEERGEREAEAVSDAADAARGSSIIADKEAATIHTLSMIAKNPGLNHTALARMLNISSPTLTKRTVRLMNLRFIVQRKDGKYTHYQLTAEGRKKLPA